jgi:hypothetical protein
MLVMTRGMNDRVAMDTDFAKHVTDSVGRFARRDWGEMADEDIKANDWSIDNGARVLAGYGEGDDRVWIIREHDGSATTILFPSEY